MRAISLACLAAACLAIQQHPAAAQGQPGAEAPSGPSATAHQKSDGRLNSLSPDEERRAARVRARAAALKARGKTGAESKTATAPKATIETKTATETKNGAPKVGVEAKPPMIDHATVAAGVKPASPPQAHAVAKAVPNQAAPDHAQLAADRPRHHRTAASLRHRHDDLASNRGPQIGDRVPTNVPLYPLPPAYGSRPPIVVYGGPAYALAPHRYPPYPPGGEAPDYP